MAVLSWDNVGQRFFETGTDRGVLYMPDQAGAYPLGVAWNGLVSVTESPSGAEPNAQYADNIKYLNLFSAEEFGATLEAFTYPDEFAQYDGLAEPETGVYVGQQNRPVFGLSYRTRLGNDQLGQDFAYKLHLVYGVQASPSEKAYSTINDSPEAITLSWELTTTPVAVTGLKPTSLIVVDSSKVQAAALTSLENALWGTGGSDPYLPLPDAVVAMFSGSVTQVTPTEPSQAGNDLTIPTITGVQYYDVTAGGTVAPPGTYTITEDTFIQARPDAGYEFPENVDTDWFYTYT